VDVSKDEYEELFKGQAQGKVIIPSSTGSPKLQVVRASEDLPLIETLWIGMEIDRSRNELEKVQDSDPNSTGSVADWRSYRRALRAWPEHTNFPNKELRPVAPDA
jgi:hypothetical protein